MVLRYLVPILLLLKHCTAFPQISPETGYSKFNCTSLQPVDFEDEAAVYVCLESKSMVIHAEKLALPNSKLGIPPDQTWIQLHYGDITSKLRHSRPLTLCVLSEKGDGAVKTLLSLDSLYISALAGITFGVFGIQWFRSSMTLNSGVMASVDRQVEYACNARPGERVQLLLMLTDYTLLGWKIRPIVVDENNVHFEEWLNIPDFVYTDDVEQVTCVTVPKHLTCDNI